MCEYNTVMGSTRWLIRSAATAVLLALCVGILVIPVTLQIISRYTPFIPS